MKCHVRLIFCHPITDAIQICALAIRSYFVQDNSLYAEYLSCQWICPPKVTSERGCKYLISVFVVGEKRQSVMKEDVHIWPYLCISIDLVITSDFKKPGQSVVVEEIILLTTICSVASHVCLFLMKTLVQLIEGICFSGICP